MRPYRAPQPIVGETSGLGLLTVIYSVATPVTSSAAFFHPPVASCFQTTSTPPSPAGAAPHPAISCLPVVPWYGEQEPAGLRVPSPKGRAILFGVFNQSGPLLRQRA